MSLSISNSVMVVPKMLNPLAAIFTPNRIKKTKKPKLKKSKTDKKRKKCKKQTRDRKVTDLKETYAEIPVDIIEIPTDMQTHIQTLEQISQICYLDKVYCLFWDYYTNKALMSMPDINLNIHNNVIHDNVICDIVLRDNVYYVAYDDMIILDIIYKHFGDINIYSEYPGSYEGLYTLVSSLPLTQYTVSDE